MKGTNNKYLKHGNIVSYQSSQLPTYMYCLHINNKLHWINQRFLWPTLKSLSLQIIHKCENDSERESVHLENRSESWLRTKLYYRRGDLNLPIVYFPLIGSNIPTVPAYGIYISKLLQYFRALGSITVSYIEFCW